MRSYLFYLCYLGYPEIEVEGSGGDILEARKDAYTKLPKYIRDIEDVDVDNLIVMEV